MKGIKQIFTLPMILLILLIYLFHTELLVIGMGIYVKFVDSPRAERFLGNYYENAAQQSVLLARTFYVDSITKLKAKLPTASVSEAPMLKFYMARSFECGRGVEQDLSEAANWYRAALEAAQASGTAASPELLQKIKDAQARVQEAIKSKQPIRCNTTTSDYEFIKDSIVNPK